MDILRKAARKICCAAGEHCYSTLMWKYTFISYDHDSLCYEVSNECVYCGKPVWSLVNIPKPRIQDQESSEAANLIQHVGYDDAQCGREK